VLRRKYMVIALATMSVLAGSLFNNNLAFGANGSSGSWGAIRFVEPNETFEDQGIWKDAATFTWIPKNSTNNAIIGDVRMYFEYKHEVVDGYVNCKLQVIGSSGQIWEYTAGSWWAESTWDYNGTDMGTWLVNYPFNQLSYTIKFKIRCDPSYPIAYVRNINIFILVADGMEPGKNYGVPLQENYNSLQSNVTELQGDYDDLSSQISELGTLRNLTYALLITTIILIATTVYLAVRKPKAKPEIETK